MAPTLQLLLLLFWQQTSLPFSSRPIFFPPSSRIAFVYQSVCRRTISDRLYYDWIVEKKLDGSSSSSSSSFVCDLFSDVSGLPIHLTKNTCPKKKKKEKRREKKESGEEKGVFSFSRLSDGLTLYPKMKKTEKYFSSMAVNQCKKEVGDFLYN